MASWFDTNGGTTITTPPGIETTNAQLVSLAAVQNNNGLYVAMFYDTTTANGGVAGSATVVATCAGIPCLGSNYEVALDPLEVLVGTPLAMTWTEEDGYVVGPFGKGEEVCLTHTAILPIPALNGIDGARFVDGTNTDHTIASSQLALASPICVSFS